MINNLSHTYIIAEAGVNHNGSVEQALGLVDAARHAGADAVKFQTFRTSKLVSRYAEKAQYQKTTTNASESQFFMLQRLELSDSDHAVIKAYCEKIGIDFMSSPFDHESLGVLVNRFNLQLLKLGSGELTNAPLLLSLAQTGKPLILSTGMATLDEVEEALGVLAFGYLELGKPTIEKFRMAFASTSGQELLREKVTLLHCTTQYPTPTSDVNLRAMDTLANSFGLPVGFSDHTEGWVMSLAAVARGACVVEKHFTLDRTLPGPDHKASLEPAELAQMIDGIRCVEQGLGNGIKGPTSSEMENMLVARKSLIAAQTVCKGDLFSEENLTIKRPGNGISPIYYWDYLGKQSKAHYEMDEVICDNE